MRKRRIKTKIKAKLEAISSPVLVVSLCLQFFALFSFSFSLLLKRLKKVPSPGLKDGIYRLRSFRSHAEQVFFLKQEIGQCCRAQVQVLWLLGFILGILEAVYLRLGTAVHRFRRYDSWPQVCSNNYSENSNFCHFDPISTFFPFSLMQHYKSRKILKK